MDAEEGYTSRSDSEVHVKEGKIKKKIGQIEQEKVKPLVLTTVSTSSRTLKLMGDHPGNFHRTTPWMEDLSLSSDTYFETQIMVINTLS
eukprot:1387169-Amorphochlora_amoeboformis.AAC.2